MSPDGPLVVLVGPRRGANVGAACRAVRNMGGSGLVVVGGGFDADEARRTAVHAADLFDSRRTASSLEEAVAGCRLVVGTSSRDNPWKLPTAPVDEVLAGARQRGLDGTQVALVFGPEDRGLSNDELSRCHRVAHVRTAGEYDSLNLAQAVVVCLYEWGMSARRSLPAAAPAAVSTVASAGTADADDAAGAAAQAAALDDLAAVLAEIGFLHGDQAPGVWASVASMLTRGGLGERDVRILRGIVRQVRWAARRGSSPPPSS